MAIVAKGLQVIVVVPAPKQVTAAVSGNDVIDLDPASFRAYTAMLARPLVAASNQFSGRRPMVLLTVPAAASVGAPPPSSLGKQIAAAPAVSIPGRDQRADRRLAGSGIHDIAWTSLPCRLTWAALRLTFVFPCGMLRKLTRFGESYLGRSDVPAIGGFFAALRAESTERGI